MSPFSTAPPWQPKTHDPAQPTTYEHSEPTRLLSEGSIASSGHTISPSVQVSQYDSVRLDLNPHFSSEMPHNIPSLQSEKHGPAQPTPYGYSNPTYPPSEGSAAHSGYMNLQPLHYTQNDSFNPNRPNFMEGAERVTPDQHKFEIRDSDPALRKRQKEHARRDLKGTKLKELVQRLTEVRQELAKQGAEIRKFIPKYEVPNSSFSSPQSLTLASAKGNEIDSVLNSFVGKKGRALTQEQKNLAKSDPKTLATKKIKRERLKIRNMIQARDSRTKNELTSKQLELEILEGEILIEVQDAEIQDLQRNGVPGS